MSLLPFKQIVERQIPERPFPVSSGSVKERHEPLKHIGLPHEDVAAPHLMAQRVPGIIEVLPQAMTPDADSVRPFAKWDRIIVEAGSYPEPMIVAHVSTVKPSAPALSMRDAINSLGLIVASQAKGEA